MRRRAGFGNCDHVAAPNDPGQCNGGRRAVMCGANLCQGAVTEQGATLAAEWGVRHHRHTVLLAPRQKVTLNGAVVETVRDLIGRAATTIWHTEEILHLANVEI